MAGNILKKDLKGFNMANNMDINEIMKSQREFFQLGRTKNVEYRRAALEGLRISIEENEEEIMEALKEDLGKSNYESFETEIGMVYSELSYMSRKIEGFARPKRVATPISNFPSSSRIYKEPYGSVLIMSPWNYPFMLTMEPLIGALSAGNCAVVKPSNYSKATSMVISKIINQAFDPEYVFAVQGGREANQSLLEEKFDYIFFTGGKAVGRKVMEAAAKNLTPVTLELGGKSPCIVDKTANIDMAARRIVWGKFLNCGQTCVAPDYVLVDKEVKEQLCESLTKYIYAMYGENPLESKDYPKIINEKHFQRLRGLLESDCGDGVDSEPACIGGQFDVMANKIAPTILPNATWESKAMADEIFGPILPILEFDDLTDVKEMVCSRPKPLALYLFTTSKGTERYILNNISFGGGCINDTIMHLATSRMPFGGVGESGMGNYHGIYSFDTFSHQKSILKKSNLIDVPLRYPPFGQSLCLLRKVLK